MCVVKIHVSTFFFPLEKCNVQMFNLVHKLVTFVVDYGTDRRRFLRNVI